MMTLCGNDKITTAAILFPFDAAKHLTKSRKKRFKLFEIIFLQKNNKFLNLP
jgi:hypothetical protein